jgi:NHL repeat-containing protein
MRGSAVSEEQTGQTRRSRSVPCLVALSVLLAVTGAVSASAEPDPQAPDLPTSAEVIDAIESEAPGSIEIEPTDLTAAEELPHQNLDRAGALELLQGVFESPLDATAGIFDGLEVEKFLAPNVALVQAPSPEGGGGGSADEGELADSVLLESSIPLRTESSSGDVGAVDLSLEHVDGEIQPANALVEVGLPAELGEGIELPGADLTIQLAGGPANRATSIVDQSIGFLPNVALDTDLAIAPTPTGVETFTHLRSADAPRSQTFNLDLPATATLQATEGGGAVVRSGEEILVSVSPPTAIDAAGADIPVDLAVEGSSITLDVAVDQQTSFPVLVDPLYQTYDWAKSKYWQSGICNSSFEETTSNNCNVREEWGYEKVENPAHHNIRLDNRAYGLFSPVPQGTPGLFIETSHDLHSGDKGTMNYTVPRYFTDQEKTGFKPTSFISNMTLWNLDWNALSSSMSPYIFAGIWDSVNGWVSHYSHEGLTGHGVGDMNWKYEFKNPASNTNVKVGAVSVQATQTGSNQNTEAYVGSASIALGDNGLPGMGLPVGPTGWVNQSAQVISLTATDTGLGVHSLVAASQPYSWKTTLGCVGVGGSPCPRTWSSTDAGAPALKYEPSLMPQGITNLSIVAEDPVGNKSAPATAQVKVDHSQPKLALSGSLVDHASSGTKAAQYTLKYDATDGDHAAASALAPFGSAGTGEGKFQRPQGMALDPSGNAWVVDRENNRVMKFDQAGKFLLQFGSLGSANGQFNDPRGIAISSNGTVWVSDVGNKRVQAFNSQGVFIRKITSELTMPYGLATGPGEVLWVSDPGTARINKYSEGGSYLGKVYGSSANPTGGSDLNYPVGLATDAAGNVWAADSGNSRLKKYDASGKYIMQLGTTGTEAGQLKLPLYVAVAPSGNLLVTEELNNRIQVFQPNGTFLRQFGSSGTGNAQLLEGRGIAMGADNTALVVDAGNRRIVKWSHADQDPQSGIVSTEIKVDGQLAEPKYAPGCATKSCAVSREWALDANDYPTGTHKVEVTATDGVGLSTTKELSLNADSTAPKLTAASPFFLTPKGWVEQKTYSYSATMADSGGYGVTSFIFKIDGQVVKSTTQSCPNGACSASFAGSIDMATYGGGAHPAEFVATDAAGNTTKITKTFNVDPEGNISVAEAANTLDAADATSESTVVASTAETYGADERADGNNPSLEEGADDDELESRGTSNLSVIGVNPEDGFTISLPDSTLHIEPTQVAGGATEMEIVEDSAAVASNSRQNVDSVVRPIFSGVTSFQNIRDATSPETYSWEVSLAEGQTLRSIDPLDAEVVYENGTVALLISAERAHDAVGTNVPTTLSVSDGNIITLSVSHQQASIVYPVIAGSGWEGGYTSEVVVGPKDEQEIKEDEERRLKEEYERVNREAEEELAVGDGADEPFLEADDVQPGPGSPRRMITAVGAPEMWDWQQRKRRSKFEVGYCDGLSCDNWHTWGWGTWFWNGVRGQIGGYAWQGDTSAKCATEADHPLYDTTLHAIGWSGPNPAPYGYGKYLNFWCSFRVNRWDIQDGPVADYYQLQDHLYGSGHEGEHLKDIPPPYKLLG